jgi:hypothetical protein
MQAHQLGKPDGMNTGHQPLCNGARPRMLAGRKGKQALPGLFRSRGKSAGYGALRTSGHAQIATVAPGRIDAEHFVIDDPKRCRTPAP